MAARILIIFFLTALLPAPGAKKTTATAKGENEDLILTVTLYLEPGDIKELLGADLGTHFIVADARIEPKYGKEVGIDRDDFQLRTDKDGEKAKPFAASQIAGSGALVITQKSSSEGVQSPGWTGMGGPVILGGGGRGGKGRGSEPDASGNKPTMQNDEKENPLKKLLESRILPEKKTETPVSGLLYFVMEKQKMKDLELTYGGRENRISLRFKP
jgi:hypothetical protein